MTHRLDLFLKRMDRLIHRAARGDEEALDWCGFWTLTAISLGVMLVVGLLLWWFA